MRSAAAAAAAAVAVLAVPAPAGAATIGQLADGTAGLPCTNVTRVQDSTGSESRYAVPAGGGVITGWSTLAGGASSAKMRLKVMRRTGDPAEFAVVGESALESLAPGGVNTFPTRITVEAGDVIGVRTEGGADCAFATLSPLDVVRSQLQDTLLPTTPPPSDPGTGSNARLAVITPSTRLNVIAELETDADGDGRGDTTQDNCAGSSNVSQADLDGDGRGDACDDSDGDGVIDANDLCAMLATVDNTDSDGDGVGDACDLDDDGDGIPDTRDAYPLDPLRSEPDPSITGPVTASTVRVDSKGRFRIAAVSVTCPPLSPGMCDVLVDVGSAKGRSTTFVRRTFQVRPGATLQLKKLKVTRKGRGALAATGAARVVATITASRPGGQPVARAIRLKLKPAKR